MPGAYENRYDEGIQNALAGMDSANSAGLGFDSQNGTYRGALSRLFGNAGAGASAAEQVANSLSGGSGPRARHSRRRPGRRARPPTCTPRRGRMP